MHPPLVEPRGMLSQGSVGKGCGGEGVSFPSLRHAAQSLMLRRAVVRTDPGMTRASCDNMHISTDPTHLKAQTYLSHYST